MQLLISGADQGKRGAVGVRAVLLVYDTASRTVLHETSYIPEDTKRHPDQKVQFTGYCWLNDRLYVCTHNEIAVFEDWPATKPARFISEKGFNDLHHCMPWQGHLAVSNTGLETVDLFSEAGQLEARYDLLKNIPEARTIDPEKDYRLIPDTKPHLRHGNHLFDVDGVLWTSQLWPFDAVSVTEPGGRWEMGAGMPHDGEYLNGKYVFTTTNGHLVLFEGTPPHDRTIVDLNKIPSGLNQLGWCRGVAAIPGTPDEYLVGFSSLRRSNWKDFGYFIKYGHTMPHSRIARYDVKDKRLIDSWDIGPDLGYQLFQVQVLPKEREL